MGLETVFTVLEDGLRSKKAAEQVYEGAPVSLDTDGLLVASDNTMTVYGLSKLNSNDNEDLASEGTGMYGSGQLTILRRGICKIQKNVFGSVEIGTSGPLATATTVEVLNNETFVPGASLYVNASGLITQTSTSNTDSLLGSVVSWDATNKILECDVNPEANAA